ncbi:hypothetical protein [Nitrosopumilus sp.]|uniref:hypothetical protein n=1 Tax=Nitrosopumilus sp. TaxID=2024843 RepID=UPI003D0D7650
MIDPKKFHPRTYIFKKIIENLKKKINVDVCWIICQPDKFSISENEQNSIYDIHSFSNANDIIKKIKPDVIFVDKDKDLIQNAITTAAKLQEIPIIARPSMINYNPTLENNSSKNIKIRNFFSTQVPSDESSRGFMRRGKFFFYKFLFLIHTKISIKENFFNIISSSLNEFFHIAISRNQSTLNPNIDLHLIVNSEQANNYEKFGIKKSNLKLVGNIWLDRFFEIIDSKELELQKNVKILIISSPLFEHGIWSSNQREDFLSELFSILNAESKFSISLKIHPTSESQEYYNNLLKSKHMKIPIFQSEELLELIPNYDLFITYGASNALTELAFCQKRVINIPLKQPIESKPLVNEAIFCGFIKKCDKLQDLLFTINNSLEIVPKPNEDYLDMREKFFFNSDGKSAERASDAVMEFLSKTH